MPTARWSARWTLPAVRAELERARADGIEAVAIVFMHAYRYPEHERAVAELARGLGFPQVSVSHEVSPLIKFVGRGDTTVVDAYLSPIIRGYVAQVAEELNAGGAASPLPLVGRGRGWGSSEGAQLATNRTTPLPNPPPQGGREQAAASSAARLMFMMSSGGLTAAELFQGKDAILSGPASGVVGMAETGREAGFQHLIGFDMGGTSTDVSHFDGEYERAFETEVAGVRMRAPMMLIHTVAAGGGSILHFDGARFRVGPDSAAANPGPTCYRRGGPLALTDANVMVGKLIGDFFPKIFGPNQDQPLDAEAVRAGFAKLAREVGDGRSAGGGRRRLHQDRGREHGERDQEDLGAARLRRDALCAQLLRRRGRPARLPGRRRARHDQGADPSVLVAAFGLRHGACRYPRDPAAGNRGDVRRSGAAIRRELSAESSAKRRATKSSARASPPTRSACMCAPTSGTRERIRRWW